MTAEYRKIHDLRWCLLLVAVSFIGLSSCREVRQVVFGICLSSNQIKSWYEMGLVWKSVGCSAGVYGGGRSNFSDPRLAIFTFQPLDLNHADAHTLQTVKGIGPKLAHSIVSYRLKNGVYNSIDDLSAVRGIGPLKLAILSKYLVLN